MRHRIRHTGAPLARRAALAAMYAAVVAASLATTGCGYRDLGRAKTESAAVWGEISQVYAARTRHADAAIAAAGKEAGFDPAIIANARNALSRAAALPPQPQLLEDARAIDNFKRYQGELTGALFRLVVTAQNFPALREDVSIQALRAQLTQAETQLTAARERYGRSASAYNALTQTFPSAVTAKLFGYGPMPVNL